MFFLNFEQEYQVRWSTFTDLMWCLFLIVRSVQENDEVNGDAMLV